MTSPARLDAALLDHMVVNVRCDMDRAAEQFAALGFQLTPRGYHTLGSINHLMVLQTDFLELIGLPDPGATGRPELLAADVGWNGLVFRTTDVEASHARLAALDMAGDPPRAFSRPVEIDGQPTHARFRTVTARAGLFPGRVYFCEHGTPQNIWRAPWQVHPNGAVATSAFVIVARDPAAEARRYADLLERPVQPVEGGAALDLGGSQLLLLDHAAGVRRFGDAVPTPGTSGSAFAAVSLRSADLGAARAFAGAAGVGAVVAGPSRVVVHVRDFDTLIEFTA